MRKSVPHLQLRVQIQMMARLTAILLRLGILSHSAACCWIASGSTSSCFCPKLAPPTSNKTAELRAAFGMSVEELVTAWMRDLNPRELGAGSSRCTVPYTQLTLPTTSRG